MINLRFVTALAACVFLSGPSSVPTAQAFFNSKKSNNFEYVTRSKHYTHDQGSRIIAVLWLENLNPPQGKSFHSSGVSRYGYTPMQGPSENFLDVFPVSGVAVHQVTGLTSFACQTPEVAVFGKRYSFDTNSKRTDFNERLLNIDPLQQAVASDAAAFEAFSKEILYREPQKQKNRSLQKIQVTL